MTVFQTTEYRVAIKRSDQLASEVAIFSKGENGRWISVTSSSDTPSTSTQACACISLSSFRAPRMILASTPSRQRIHRSTKDFSRQRARYKLCSAAIRTRRAATSGRKPFAREGRAMRSESLCRRANVTKPHAIRTVGKRAAAWAKIINSRDDNFKSFFSFCTSVFQSPSLVLFTIRPILIPKSTGKPALIYHPPTGSALMDRRVESRSAAHPGRR